MTTDTPFTSLLRDTRPDEPVTLHTTPDAYLRDHDAALVVARQEGAYILLDHVLNVVYLMESSGHLDKWGAEHREGFLNLAKLIQNNEPGAIQNGSIDFSSADSAKMSLGID